MAEEARKVKYKATYWPEGQNPFTPRLRYLTKTAEVDATLPLEEVERLAREAGEGNRLIRVEVVS